MLTSPVPGSRKCPVHCGEQLHGSCSPVPDQPRPLPHAEDSSSVQHPTSVRMMGDEPREINPIKYLLPTCLPPSRGWGRTYIWVS